jgi:hypothetical protein
MSNTNRWPTDLIQRLLNLALYARATAPFQKVDLNWDKQPSEDVLENMDLSCIDEAQNWLKSLQDSAPNIGENPIKGAGDDNFSENPIWVKGYLQGCDEGISKTKLEKDEEIQRLKDQGVYNAGKVELLTQENKALQKMVRELENIWASYRDFD